MAGHIQGIHRSQKIKALKKHREEHEALQQQLEKSEDRQISLTDPDARSMPVGMGKILVNSHTFSHRFLLQRTA
jgi:hypothetical protein